MKNTIMHYQDTEDFYSEMSSCRNASDLNRMDRFHEPMEWPLSGSSSKSSGAMQYFVGIIEL